MRNNLVVGLFRLTAVARLVLNTLARLPHFERGAVFFLYAYPPRIEFVGLRVKWQRRGLKPTALM